MNFESLTDIILSTLGLLVGSFLNVVVFRAPRGESIVFPGSHCPSCGRSLQWWENVPVASWLALRGRCRSCHARISVRYPLVELMTGALFALSAIEYGPTLETFSLCVLSAVLVIVLFIDLDHLLILDSVVVACGIAGILLSVASHRVPQALESAAIGAGAFGAVYVATRGAGMGLGDVKFAAAAGLFLNVPNAIASYAASFVVGALVAIPVLIARRRGRRDALAFGPFLVIAIMLAAFAPGILFGPFQAYRTLIDGGFAGR